MRPSGCGSGTVSVRRRSAPSPRGRCAPLLHFWAAASASARSCGPEGAVQGVEDGGGLSCLRRGIGDALYLYAHGGDQLCGGRWCPDSRSYGLYVRIDTFETGRVHDDDRDAGFAHRGECFLVPSVAYNQIRVLGNYLLSVGLEISNLLYLN